jgi:hypothetical protein
MKPYTRYIPAVILTLIVSIAAVFRFTGLNWDTNTHLHPDERFLTMVAGQIAWPQSIQAYFDTQRSPLNPHNQGFDFYVYGTWPVVGAKWFAQALNRDTYDLFPVVARAIAATADILTVVFVFLITWTATKGQKYRLEAAALAAFLYATMVLPIQLAHFFTVDPFATLCMTIALFLLVRNRASWTLGIATGLAIGAKVSSLIVLIPIALHYGMRLPTKSTKQITMHIVSGLLFFIVCALTLWTSYPYLFDGFGLDLQTIQNFKQLKSFDGANTTFPPGLQWIGTTPLLFPLKNMIAWGLGFPHSMVILLGIAMLIATYKKKHAAHPLDHHAFWILGVAIVSIFAYQGMQFAKAMRYFYALYPALAALGGWGFAHLLNHLSQKQKYWIYGLTILLLVIWPLSYIRIYTKPTTRVAASTWIYATIPSGATLAWEHWDDPIPLAIDGKHMDQFKAMQLPMYDPDTQAKWKKITTTLAQTDYIILSSNRVYASTQQDARLPITKRYYETLFSGLLGFEPVAQFTSRPGLPFITSACIHMPGFSYGTIARIIETCDAHTLSIVDDYADETFTVYDHPKVIIFQKKKPLTATELLESIIR